MATLRAPADTARMAKLFHALSDEKRLRIIEQLRRAERCVCDLQEGLDAGQSLLSFHLKTLKAAGIVTDRREGRWAYYSLVPGVLEEVEQFAAELRADAEAAAEVKCCG